MSINSLCSTCSFEEFCPIKIFYYRINPNEETTLEHFHANFIDEDFQECQMKVLIDELPKPKLRFKTRTKTLLVSKKQDDTMLHMEHIHDINELMEYCLKQEQKVPFLFPVYHEISMYYHKHKIKQIARIKQEIKNLEYKNDGNKKI